jgi:hypothetical protein
MAFRQINTIKCGWSRVLLAALLIGTTLAIELASARAQGDSRALVFFAPVRGVIDDDSYAHDWTFDGRADQVIALLVVTTRGDLDPVLEVIGPDGASIAANDDLDSLVRDAGVEALALPVDGSYTIRVSRYDGAAGTTRGEYELAITPGYARPVRNDAFDQGAVSWLTPEGDQLVLNQGRLQLRANAAGEMVFALPPDGEALKDVYIQATARPLGAVAYAEVGLVFRAQRSAGGLRAYQFKVNTAGQWTVVYQDETGTYALRTWTDHPALAGEAWTLAVLARENEFAFYANGDLLGTLTNDRLPAAGEIGLMLANRTDQDGAATILFDDVLVTARLGTTYNGVPLALTTWDSSDPGDIINELAAGGHIAPLAGHDLFLPEKTVTLTEQDAYFELIGTDLAMYGDFVMGARINIATGPRANVGCGLTYRWIDERNLDLAYVDTGGGFGVVQARNGSLTLNVYDLTPMVDSAEFVNKLLVIAQGGHVILYVNGALVAQEDIVPGEGRVGVALLNYEAVRTDCFWNDVWVWPLEPS